MVFDYSRLIIWKIEGAVSLSEVGSIMNNDNGVNRIELHIPDINPNYTIATVIAVDGFRFPVCARKLGDKWEPCMRVRLYGGEEHSAEEFLLKDKITRLAHYGKSDEE